MSTSVRIKLDHAGIGEIAKSQEVADMVNDAARTIASHAQSATDAPVVVNDYTTDRRAAAVTVASDSGLAIQAKYGLLTKAAGSIGADVTEI